MREREREREGQGNDAGGELLTVCEFTSEIEKEDKGGASLRAEANRWSRDVGSLWQPISKHNSCSPVWRE